MSTGHCLIKTHQLYSARPSRGEDWSKSAYFSIRCQQAIVGHKRSVRHIPRHINGSPWWTILAPTSLQIRPSTGVITDPPLTVASQLERNDVADLPLFRTEVRQATPQWMGRITLSQPVSSWFLSALTFCFAAAVLIFLFIGTYTRHESVQGQLVPSAGLLPVIAQSAATVITKLIHEGDAVAKDQALVELSGEVTSLGRGQTQVAVLGNLQAQLKELEALLENQERLEVQQQAGLNDRIQMLNKQVTEIDRQLSLQQEVTAIAELRLEKLKPGARAGTFSQVEIEKYQADALNGNAQLNILARQRLDTEQQLRTLQDQLQQLPLSNESQRNELRFRLSGINQSLAQNEAQRAVVLRAPRDGVVTNLIVQNGQTVAAGQRLLSILPEGSFLQAELWLPSRAIGFLETGNRVVLRYPAFPYQKFGQKGGRVLEVSRSATAASELTGLLGRTISEPLYRVVVELDQQTVSAYGKAEPLKPGMTVDADILLDRRHLIEWVLEPLYGVSRSLQGPIPAR
jgi:membrane fusion protein